MGTEGVLLVDPSILTWILLPLVFLTLVSVFVRTYASKLLSETKPPSAEELGHKNLLVRAQRLRAHGGYVSHAGFAMRKAYLVDEGGGAAPKGRLLAELPAGGGAAPDPMAMVKQQMVMMGTQMGLGYFTETFTSGFVALRMPFSLTERFKSMTQAGIGVSALDTTYVSSTSWYMMTMFGLPQVLRLFARGGGASSLDEARMMQMQMGGMMGGAQPGAPFNAAAAYKAERENVLLAEWAPAPLLQAEQELLDEARVLAEGGDVGGPGGEDKKAR